ncbi:hypothetical protein Aduo_004335 [Ancylostoma duodenale]
MMITATERTASFATFPELLEAEIGSALTEPDGACSSYSSQASVSNQHDILEAFEKLRETTPALFQYNLRYHHAYNNVANNRQSRNSADLEEHDRLARLISEELKQNWNTISQKQQARKEGRKAESFPTQEAIEELSNDPLTCLKNFTNTLRAAVQGCENFTEEPNPIGDPTSCMNEGPSRPRLPKEPQDHNYSAPPPAYSQKSDEEPGKTTKKRKKGKDPKNDKSLRPTPAYLKMRAQQARDYSGDLDLQLKKELVRRRLFGGFAPCHFVLYGLSGPIEMQCPTTPKDLLEQIIHLQSKSSHT